MNTTTTTRYVAEKRDVSRTCRCRPRNRVKVCGHGVVIETWWVLVDTSTGHALSGTYDTRREAQAAITNHVN